MRCGSESAELTSFFEARLSEAGRPNRPSREASEGFIKPEDVASSVLHMVQLPLGANVLDMTVIPTRQPLIGRG